jgi:hypothetical protein
MGGNLAGIYGAQIFRQDDRPRYRRAFVIGLSILAGGILLSTIRYIDDKVLRRKGKNPNGTDKVTGDSNTGSEDGEERVQDGTLGVKG